MGGGRRRDQAKPLLGTVAPAGSRTRNDRCYLNSDRVKDRSPRGEPVDRFWLALDPLTSAEQNDRDLLLAPLAAMAVERLDEQNAAP
jgi:hypothetical protein